jgi:FixJ family two-component response regulator
MNLPRTRLIAIVDGDFRLRRYLERLLSAAGYPNVSFAAADEFLTDAQIVQPACLILDLDLKDGSGRELAHHPTIRALQCPLIFMSATSDEVLQRQVSQMRNASCLKKPFRAVDILPLIVKALPTR